MRIDRLPWKMVTSPTFRPFRALFPDRRLSGFCAEMATVGLRRFFLLSQRVLAAGGEHARQCTGSCRWEERADAVRGRREEIMGGLLLTSLCVALAAAPEAEKKESYYDDRPLSVWLTRLKDKDAAMRREAAHALGRLEPPTAAAVPALGDALKHADDEVRATAAEALGWIGPEAKDALPRLRDAVAQDENARVRAGAAFALGRIGRDSDAVVPALIEALKDRKAEVRDSAARGLFDVGLAARPAVPALVGLLKDENGGRPSGGAVARAVHRRGERDGVRGLGDAWRGADGRRGP